MAISTRTYVVEPIPAPVVAQLLDRDDAGRRPRVLTEGEGGNPLRCCLRATRPGERVVLASYAPVRRWARQRGVDPEAYDEVGPVFLPAEPCDGPAHTVSADAFRASPRMLPPYAPDARILRAVPVASEGDPAASLADMLSDPAV